MLNRRLGRGLLSALLAGLVVAGLLTAAAPAEAAQAVPTLTYPVNGAQNVDTSTPFTWTTVSGALAYYLYVGSSQGAKDLVDSGATTQTSYLVPPLPAGPTLWARIWVQTSSGWTPAPDISFTAASGKASFTYPANGASNVDTSKRFTWTTPPGAQAYYLYVGTSQGAKDLVDTGAITQSSFQVPSLPSGPVLWARIYTEINNTWIYYSEISFTAAVGKAAFIYPTNGSTSVDSRRPFQWTSVTGAQGYYLWVGSSKGTKDLVDSGTLASTSYTVPQLPVGPTLWARVWTKINGSFSAYNDISFTNSYNATSLTYPLSGVSQPYVDVSLPFQWKPALGAQAYYLWIGSSQGSEDILDSGALNANSTSYQVPALPVGQQLWARLWTETSGSWVYASDVPFFAGLEFAAPVNGSVTVDRTRPFQWSSGAVINGAQPTYSLTVGSAPGGSDLLSAKSLSQNSYTVPASSLPSGRVLYARVTLLLGDGSKRVADSVFTTSDTPVAPSQMIAPAPGAQTVDTSDPWQWTKTDLAQAYRVQVWSGTTLLHDSGLIRTSRYFAEDLAAGSYTAQLATEIAGTWYYQTFSFTVAATGSSMTKEIASAQWATDQVRHMADANDYAYTFSELWTQMNMARAGYGASCGSYANTLLADLREMNIAGTMPSGQQPQRNEPSFISDGFDTHVNVVLYDTDDQDWIVLDPTFDLMMKRASDGHWATDQDAHNATLAQTWSAISYVFLGDFGNSLAHAYYLDYPLLYLNLPPTPAIGSGADPMPYLRAVPPPNGQFNSYAISSNQASTQVVVDGKTVTLATNAIDGLSGFFNASTVALPPGSTATITVFTAQRYVF